MTLEDRIALSLEFACSSLARFDHYVKDFPTDESVDGYDHFQIKDKFIAETAILLLVASRIRKKSENIDRLVNELTGRLSAASRDNRIRLYLMRFPQTASSLGLVHAILKLNGRGDLSFDALLNSAFNSGHIENVERPPFRRMDIRWMQSLLKSESPDYSDLVDGSIIKGNPHPIYMSRTDAYAYTHELMYLSNFGMNEIYEYIDPAKASAIVDANLAWTIVCGDLDLLGEFLIANSILRTKSAAAQLGWQLMLATWDKLGFLPGPAFNANVFSTLTGTAAQSYQFRHSYHTVFVCGILCAISANNPSVSDELMPQCVIEPELLSLCKNVVERAVQFCSADIGDYSEGKVESKSSSHSSGFDWLANAKLPEFFGWETQLPSSKMLPDKFCRVLADGVLIRAAREYDLTLLAQAMLAATKWEQPSLTFIEATKFLLRQQLESGVIGPQLVMSSKVSPESIRSVTGWFAFCLAEVGVYLENLAARRQSMACSS